MQTPGLAPEIAPGIGYYCQHRSRGPGPHGELPQDQAHFTSPKPSSPAGLPRSCAAPHPRPSPPPPPTALAQLHKGPCPPPAHPTPKSAREWRQSLGDKEIFFSFLPRIDHPASPSPTVGRGRHKGTPSTPPKREKTLTFKQGPEVQREPAGEAGDLGPRWAWLVCAEPRPNGVLRLRSVPSPPVAAAEAASRAGGYRLGPSHKCLICLIALLSHNRTLRSLKYFFPIHHGQQLRKKERRGGGKGSEKTQ